ncbi:LacI family DNA-binding transcriptional regulator [Solirubrobacter soli]|uniref:LacI family DNA-binding transcriptional regulator n=1 Tax=Solirubrobacter soli TaxID=363832 RepID=UPI0003F56174|nr:LacI family DNA-binding transcriptional regulator [Solirubrobacter soli]
MAAPGRPPTMEDVAAAAGVSRALVSLVMRGSPKVSEARRQAVLDAAERLQYRPNAMARGLASSRTMTIGVLLNDLHNPFFADIAGGIEALASELGYQLLLGTGRRRPERERTVVSSFADYRVDGLILVSPRFDEDALVSAASRIPTVVIGRELEAPEFDTVVIDEPLGVRAVVSYLAGLGHRDILHVTGGDGAGAAARVACFHAAMEAAGLGPGRTLPGDFTEEAGVRAAQTILTRGELPTAVFAANDLTAAGMMDTFLRGGIRIPADVSLVGYDNIYIAELRQLSLTTVDQPRQTMGRQALELLIERIEGRQERVTRIVEPTLVVRDTAGRVRQ